MADDPLSVVKKAASDLRNRYAAGNQQSSQLGTELGEAQKMRELGRQALSPSTAPAAPASKSSPTPPAKRSPKTDYGAHPERGENRIPDATLKEYSKPLGSMKKGGKVPKTGMYQLHKDETVVPAKKSANALGGKSKPAKKGSAKKPHKMVIRHNDDDTFSVTHQHAPDMQGGMTPKDEEFTAPNVKRLKQHVGMTFAPEQEAQPMAGEQ